MDAPDPPFPYQLVYSDAVKQRLRELFEVAFTGPVALATSVRVRDGKRLVTDGPFAETHEQLGGFFLIEADNLDDAIAIAARIPGARKGAVEVRPVRDLTGLPEVKS